MDMTTITGMSIIITATRITAMSMGTSHMGVNSIPGVTMSTITCRDMIMVIAGSRVGFSYLSSGILSAMQLH
jgi:hypothetical protein